MHGLPQKIGQLMALEDPGGPSAFGALTESPSAVAPQVALDLLEAALGCPWSRHFRSIDGEGIAASLGQVHKGVLADGRAVAVKIRYPESAGNVDTSIA